jgi:hypothetical protein
MHLTSIILYLFMNLYGSWKFSILEACVNCDTDICMVRGHVEKQKQ